MDDLNLLPTEISSLAIYQQKDYKNSRIKIVFDPLHEMDRLGVYNNIELVGTEMLNSRG